jgi:CheY-like chemotaxis protein
VTGLNGVRVLVVEDEATVAMLIEDMLEDLGCTVVASIASLAAARDVATGAEIDLAMLDVNVAGELIFPIAHLLRERRIPFLFSTGYGMAGLPAEFLDCPVLAKPFSQSELQEKVVRALDR